MTAMQHQHKSWHKNHKENKKIGTTAKLQIEQHRYKWVMTIFISEDHPVLVLRLTSTLIL
uniref:Uncharacterized protein n=1 Tax=Arundo donax TaxID=35708 RepID=A0A0A9CNM1_ARUDO